MARAEGPIYRVAMPQSLAFVLVHVVFSTKNRQPFLNETVRPLLSAYMATVVRGAKCDCLRVGGVANHVHLAIRLHPTRSIAELVEEVKTSSSKWLKTQSPELDHFAWQKGYGAFSVSPSDHGALVRYIAQQEAHHRRRTFEDEMRAFFTKYHVPFDERYLWT